MNVEAWTGNIISYVSGYLVTAILRATKLPTNSPDTATQISPYQCTDQSLTHIVTQDNKGIDPGEIHLKLEHKKQQKSLEGFMVNFRQLLLELYRNTLRNIISVITVHCYIRSRTFLWGYTPDFCRLCQEEEELENFKHIIGHCPRLCNLSLRC